jgi:UDP-N-acetyl-D-mannosaminuronic acid transferase (WecB/TagA/CpsF family)
VGPDIVIVGLGTPLQELWMAQQAHRLKATTV